MQKNLSATAFNNINNSKYHSNQCPVPSRTQIIDQGSLRPTSPHSKTKIKLVSPFKQKGMVQRKQNNNPIVVNTTTYKNVMQIQLGGKITQINHQKHYLNIQVPIQISKKVVKPFASHNFKKDTSKVDSFVSLYAEPKRAASPTKIVINNKCFDIAALKSKVVMVTPLKSKQDLKQLVKCEQIRKSGGTEELLIQQQNSLQDLKESYESEMREIKQLQQQIQDNNVQIKELLKCSNVSRNLASSRSSTSQKRAHTQQNYCQQQFAEKIKPQIKSSIKLSSNQLPKQEIKLSQSNKQNERDEVSVQTDFPQYLQDQSIRNQSRFQKWTVTKNKESQINFINTRSQDLKSSFLKQKSNKQIFAYNAQVKKSQQQMQINENMHLQLQPETIQQIIPVSQRSIQSIRNSKVTQNGVEQDLKVSRAESLKSFIQQNQFKLKSKLQIQSIKNESSLSAKQDQLTRSKMDYPCKQIQNSQRQIQTIVNAAPSSLDSPKLMGISSGKRRINNSIYL